MRIAGALFVAFLCACSGSPPARESGSSAPPPGSCLDNEAGREYMHALWTALQEAWTVPEGVPAEQSVEVALDYDALGDPAPPVVVGEASADLRASVEKALTKADLPATPDELRTCLAHRQISGTFRNFDSKP